MPAERFNQDLHDQHWMALALEEARAAVFQGEVPIGAVLIDAQGELLARAGNAPIAEHDPTAHAEIRVIRMAAQKVGNYRLPGTTLYVTLEPCPMCAGAIIHARVTRVVYGALDPKTGAAGSVHKTLISPRHNHRPELAGGVLGDESARLLQDFFRKRREGRESSTATSGSVRKGN